MTPFLLLNICCNINVLPLKMHKFVLMLFAGLAFAQTKPAFEVATVKPAPPLDIAKVAAGIRAGQMPKMGAHVEAGRAEYTYVAMRELIVAAYGVKPYQVTGPDWMTSTRFDIVAKMPEGSTKDDAPKMLQALLEDRFKLSVHKSSAEHPVLALVVGKGGPKLKESASEPKPIDETAELKPGQMKMDGPDGPIRVTVGKDGSSVVDMGAKGKISYKVNPAALSIHLDGSMVTMSGFADMLTQLSQMGGGSGGRQIVDMTGLTGHYEVALDFGLTDLLNMARAAGFDLPVGAGRGGPGGGVGPADAASDPSSSAQSVNNAVQALGLKLESRKAVIEQLIVDHVEKTPTEN
jgi:uncharacterized protein (TIGR03435 family)